MLHPLVRRIVVLLLAVLVTAGMGLPAVQASAMTMNGLDMSAGMSMSGMSKCNDCGTSGSSKGMMACTASVCSAQIAAPLPLVATLELDFVSVRHNILNRTLAGHDTVPDPYPPRTSDIG